MKRQIRKFVKEHPLRVGSIMGVILLYIALGLHARANEVRPRPASPENQTKVYAATISIPGDGTYEVVLSDRPGVVDFSMTSADGHYTEFSGTDLGGDGKGIWDTIERCERTQPYVMCETTLGVMNMSPADEDLIRAALKLRTDEKYLVSAEPKTYTIYK